jgi:hypothetical protein
MSHIAFLEERLASDERLLLGCQNSTGWEHAIPAFIVRIDRLREQIRWERIKAAHKAMMAEYEAARMAEHKAMKAEHEAAKQQQQQQHPHSSLNLSGAGVRGLPCKPPAPLIPAKGGEQQPASKPKKMLNAEQCEHGMINSVQ